MKLPGSLKIAPVDAFEGDFVRGLYQYVVNTAYAAGIAVEVVPEFGRIANCATIIEVDGQRVGLDMSDYTVPTIAHRDVDLLLRTQHGHWFEAFLNIGSFPQRSFDDWEQYGRLSASLAYRASGTQISYRVGNGQPGCPLGKRRKWARRQLVDAFSSRVLTDYVPQEQFWTDAAESFVAVNVGGSYGNIMDRAFMQLMGLGVAVICPEVFVTCCEVRPVPWYHYVPIRDDMGDLVEKVQWADAHRDELVVIGQRAQAFFRRHCLPRRIWAYVRTRLDNPQTPRLVGCEVGSYPE